MGVPMERRWTTRTPARFDVDMYCEGYDLATCQTSDISFGGVFLELGHTPPPVDSTVDLVFHCGSAGDTRARYKLPAKVVRVTDRGVGVMFRDFDAAAFRSLREIFRTKDEHAA